MGARITLPQHPNAPLPLRVVSSIADLEDHLDVLRGSCPQHLHIQSIAHLSEPYGCRSGGALSFPIPHASSSSCPEPFLHHAPFHLAVVQTHPPTLGLSLPSCPVFTLLPSSTLYRSDALRMTLPSIPVMMSPCRPRGKGMELSRKDVQYPEGPTHSHSVLGGAVGQGSGTWFTQMAMISPPTHQHPEGLAPHDLPPPTSTSRPYSSLLVPCSPALKAGPPSRALSTMIPACMAIRENVGSTSASHRQCISNVSDGALLFSSCRRRRSLPTLCLQPLRAHPRGPNAPIMGLPTMGLPIMGLHAPLPPPS